MKAIDPGDLAPRDLHRLLLSVLIPRPIALVSTLSEAGVRNLAPFSFFGGVSARPPIVSLSIARGDQGEKDTMRNIRATREFVVNVVSRALLEATILTSGAYPPSVDEFEVARLTAIPSDKIRAPRVAESPAHLECVVVDLVEQPGGAAVTVVLGRVLRFHVARRAWRDGEADAAELDVVARLGGELYAPLGTPFAMPRPPARTLPGAAGRPPEG